MVVCLCSCKSTTGSDHDQIVKSAIDLAQTYVSSQDYDKAIAVYEKALDQADDYRLSYNYALALSETGQYRQAAEVCANAFTHYPHIIAFKKAQAIFLEKDGNLSDSNQIYLEILALDPYDKEARLTLIAQLKSLSETANAYEQALVLWNQGYQEKTTIEILYEIEPQLWSNIYMN